MPSVAVSVGSSSDPRPRPSTRRGRAMRPFSRSRRVRSLFPEDEEWAAETNPTGPSEPSVPEGETAGDTDLRGFFWKRHSSARRFARARKFALGEDVRYVWCDDIRGRINYANPVWSIRHPNAVKIPVDHNSQKDCGDVPTVALPMQDVTGVRALPPDHKGHWLEISWPLHKLTIQARSEQHCAKFVKSIDSRMEHWKRHYELNGVRTATPVFGVPNGSEPAAHWRVSGRADTRRGW